MTRLPKLPTLLVLMLLAAPACAQDAATPADTSTTLTAADTLATAAASDTLAGPAHPGAAPLAAPAGNADAAIVTLGRGPLSPAGALGVGLFATFAPAVIARSALAGPGSFYAPGAAVAIGLAAGVLVGPAVGLACGGRNDLAARGLVVRAVGAAAVTAGGLAAVLALSENSDPGAAIGLLTIGGLGGLVIVGSALHDLVITPHATAEGRRVHASLGVRPDGRVAVAVTF